MLDDWFTLNQMVLGWFPLIICFTSSHSYLHPFAIPLNKISHCPTLSVALGQKSIVFWGSICLGWVGLTNESNLLMEDTVICSPQQQDTRWYKPGNRRRVQIFVGIPQTKFFVVIPGGFSFVTSHPGENWEIVHLTRFACSDRRFNVPISVIGFTFGVYIFGGAKTLPKLNCCFFFRIRTGQNEKKGILKSLQRGFWQVCLV